MTAVPRVPAAILGWLALFAVFHLIGRSVPQLATGAVAVSGSGALARGENTSPDLEAVEVLEAIDAGGAIDFPALLKAAFGLGDERGFVVGRLVERWANQDPRAALGWLAGYRPTTEKLRSARQGALDALFSEWGKVDPVAALEAGKALDRDLFGVQNVIAAVMLAQAGSAPANFLKLGEEYGLEWKEHEWASPWVYEMAFEAIGKTDRSKLSDWMNDGSQPEHITRAAARAFGATIAETVGEDCYGRLSEIESPNLRLFAAQRAVVLLVRSDLVAAGELVAKLVVDQPEEWWEPLALVAGAKAKADPAEAMRWISPVAESMLGDVDSRQEFAQALAAVYSWIPADPQVLHRFATETGPISPHFNLDDLIAYSGTFDRQGPRHHDALARGLLELPPDQLRDEMLVGVIEHWGGDYPSAALEFAVALPDGELRQAAMQKMLGDHRTPAPVLLSLMEELDGAALPWQAVQRLAREMPDQAIAHVAGLPRGERSTTMAVLAIAGVLGQHNMAAGEAWIEAITDEPTRIAAADKFASMAGYNSHRLSEWAATLPPGGTYDVVAGRLADSIASEEPDSAFAWAASIGSGEKRMAGLVHAVRSWRESDPLVAMQAIRDSDQLDTRERVALMKELEVPPE